MQTVQMITPQMLRGPPPGPRQMAPVPRGSPGSAQPGPRTYYNPRLPQQQQNRAPGSFMSYRQRMEAAQNQLFDGKRMRKAVHRKTVDYNSSVIKYLENRIWQRDFRDFRQIQPDRLYTLDLVPPSCMLNNPMNSVTTKFVRTSTNKFRCPIFCLTWTPEGRRLVTGASSGEFTLWNGLTFNFETILQAHDTSVRAMQWSHTDQWMVTADHAGFIKYWQTNMNNVKMYQGHKEAVRGISFCPTDSKFTTCSDDGTVRVWDFMRCHEEKILRGHGADVKCVDWHPLKGIIASGSKDSQQPVKLWDPKSGNSLATIHGHKSTVMSLKWNRNGNWLLTASRDHLLKLFDIRNMKEELQTFKGHKKEATAAAWHPIHESLFASGGSDGAVMFWMVGTDKEVGGMEEAHEGMVWTLAWHPLGHILASGSNDHSTKFWTRNRPGDMMRDKYNLNTLPAGTEQELLEYDLEPQSIPAVPGLGLEHGLPDHLKPKVEVDDNLPSIPGLNWTEDENFYKQQEMANLPRKKIPFSRPVPRSFEMAWKENKLPQKKNNPRSREDDRPPSSQNDGNDRPNQPHPGNRGNASNRGPPDDMRGPMGPKGPFKGPNQFQGNGGPPNMPHDMDDRRGPGNNRQMGHPGGSMGPHGGHGPMGRGGHRGPPHMRGPNMGPGPGPNMEPRGGPGPDQRQNRDEDFRRSDQDFRQQGRGPDQWQRDQPGGADSRDGFDPFNPHGGPPQDMDFRSNPPQGPGDEDLRFRGQPSLQDMGGGFDDRPGPRGGRAGQDVDYRFAGQAEGGFDQTEENWETPRGRGRGRGQPPNNNMGGLGFRHGPSHRPGNEDFDYRESGDLDNRLGRDQSPQQYGGREQSPHGFGGPQEGMRKRTYDEGPGRGRGGSFHGSRPEHMDSHGAKFGRHDSAGDFGDQFSGNRNQRGGFGHSPGGRGGNMRGAHRGRGGRGFRGGRGGRGQ